MAERGDDTVRLETAVARAVESLKHDHKTLRAILGPLIDANQAAEIETLQRQLAGAKERAEGAEGRMREEQDKVVALSLGWTSAHEMHARHHWCVDPAGKPRPYKVGEHCPTLWALEQGTSVAPWPSGNVWSGRS